MRIILNRDHIELPPMTTAQQLEYSRAFCILRAIDEAIATAEAHREYRQRDAADRFRMAELVRYELNRDLFR